MHYYVRSSIALANVAVALLLVNVPRVEAQLTRGTVSGRVHDATGAILPAVDITIVNDATGSLRRLATSADGFYRAAALEPGQYTMTFELSGFRTVEQRALVVRSALETTLDVALAPGGVVESVQVTASSDAVLDRTNPTVGLTFSGRYLSNLPLSPDRDITRLALLVPTVVSAPGASPLSANGQRSRNNNFSVDGSDNNEMTISTFTMMVPPEAVEEFQVQTNPYNVEFGRNTGAQVNVITRGGTNRLQGDLHEDYRGSALNTLSNIEKDSGFTHPPRFNQNRFGASVGGPFLRDRAFFYGLAQGTRSRSASTLGATVRVPTRAGLDALRSVPLGVGQSAASRTEVLRRLDFLRQVHEGVGLRNLQTTTVNGVPIETGQANVGRATPGDGLDLFARADVQWTPTDRTTWRVARTALTNDNVYSNVDFGSRFAAGEDVLDRQVAISHLRIFGPSLLNELRVSHVRRRLDFPEQDAASPTATINGFFTIGGTRDFPQGRLQDSFQMSDVVTLQRSRHGLKMGADLRYITLDNLAAFDSKGTFTFNNLQDYVNNRAALYRQAVQTASFEASQWQMFFFAQDDLKLTRSTTLNLGLRYETATVPLGFFGAIDHDVRGAVVPGPLQRDHNNVAPRVGLSWSPSAQGGVKGWLFGDGRGVIRSGYGVGYDLLFYNLLVLAAGNYPRVVNSETSNAFDVYPATKTATGTPVFSPTATFRNVPERAQSPRNRYWSLTYQRNLGEPWTFEFGYSGSRGANGLTQLQANPAILTAEQAATVREAEDPFSIPSVQSRRAVPGVGSRILYATVGRSSYHAAFLRLERRLRRGLQMGAAYTFSRTMSDSDELLALPDIAGASPQVPQDFSALDREWAVSAFDRPHRATVHWSYETPAIGSGPLRALGSGWQVSGVFQGQSGQPFTILTGVDSNGNGAAGDRPNYDSSGRLVVDPKTGNLKSFTTSGMFLVPSVDGEPLPNSLGNGNLGRNTLRAAAWFTWDLSLSRRFMLGRHRVTLRADVYNAFNQDNYGVPVNVMNDLSFGQNVNDWGRRSMTLGARYEF